MAGIRSAEIGVRISAIRYPGNGSLSDGTGAPGDRFAPESGGESGPPRAGRLSVPVTGWTSGRSFNTRVARRSVYAARGVKTPSPGRPGPATSMRSGIGGLASALRPRGKARRGAAVAPRNACSGVRFPRLVCGR